MKKVSLYFIKRPVLVNFILALNFILGGYFIYKVPKEAFPGVSMNQIVIITKYPGASAKDVELNITSKIEDKIAEIGNIKEYRSSSIESVSRITVFASDDLNDFQFKDLLSDVESEVDKIDDFPSDIEGRPIITSVTTEDRPIMEIAFSGSYDLLKRKLPQIENDLRRVSGVSTVTAVGLPDEEIHIEVDAKRALDKDIDLNSVYHAINTRNQVGTGGTLESFIAQKKIVSFNKYEKAEDVLDTIVRMSPDGQGVYLRDVAKIIYRPKDEKLIVRNNGTRGASILVAIRSGVDQLKISDHIKELLSNEDLPEGVSYKLNNDVSDNARSKFALLKNNGLIGFGLVLLLLFYFLGGKPAFWTAFGIPFTVFGSMILFVPMGMTLNSVSMGAFVIVLGLIVDDAMVISERFDVNIEKGETAEEAASNAVGELWRPVLAASLTTVTAFMPLLSLGGLPGKFIWQMPAVVMIALFVSLIDCYLLLPAHLAHGRIKKGAYKKSRAVIWMEDFYEGALTQILRYRYWAISGFLLLLVMSIFIGATKVRKDSFPQEASEGFSIKITLKKGYAPEKVEEIIQKFEKNIEDLKEDELMGYTARLGTHSLSSLTSIGTEENLVTFLVYLTPYSERERTASEIVSEIRSRNIEEFNSKGYGLEFDLMRVGPPLGEPFEIILSSNINKKRELAANRVLDFLKGIKGLSDVKDDNIPGKDEINLKLNYKKVARAGLTPLDIIRTLRIAFDGQVVTDYSSINKSYDFRLRLDKKSRGDFDFISKLPIANNRGQLIHLNTMIDYEERPSYAEIKHFNGYRSTSITGNIDSTKVTAIEMLDIFKNEFTKNKDIKYTISGRPVEEDKIFSGLKVAAGLAIIGIFFILSLMFDSYTKPFLILFVIPFGVVGIFFSFYLHDLPFSMFAGIGLIGLSGIVVNDSIVLVDHINNLIKTNGGFSKSLLIRGAKERLRPISLTTISTALAVAPTAYAIGGYDSLLSPLSLAILYGLLFGTTVVLLFLPTLYLVGDDLGTWLAKKKKKPAVSVKSLFVVSIIMGYPVDHDCYAAAPLTISKIVHKLKKTNEYQIQNEVVKESEYLVNAVDGMLDGKLSTSFFNYTSKNYPNPPISLDSERSGYGLSIDYEKMTSYGFKFGVGVGLEGRDFRTVPSNRQFYLDAVDSVYKASIAIPLFRNFASREYHHKKDIALKQQENFNYRAKADLDKLMSKSANLYWTIARLTKEKDIAEKSLARFKSLHKLNLVKKRSGIISRAELLTSEVEIVNREKKIEEIISEIKIDKIKLMSLLEDDSRVEISNERMKAARALLDITDGDMEGMIRDGVRYSQVKNQEELLKSILRVEEEIAKSNVDLFLATKSFGRGESFDRALEENTQDKYEIYAGISWEFDIGNNKNSSRIGQALSQERQAALREKKTFLELRNSFKEVKERVKSNLEQISYLEKVRAKQYKILEVEERRFRNGRISTLDYVRLQELYDRSLLQVIGLRYFNEMVALQLFTTIGNIDSYLLSYLKEEV